MVKGYIINKWTDDGLQTVLAHPQDLTLETDDLMRIFYAHITGAGHAGNIVVRLENAKANISSYFTGMDSGDSQPFMVNLVFEFDEEPEQFGEPLIKEFTAHILELVKKQSETDIQKDYTEQIITYCKNVLFVLDRIKNMTREQKIAQIYSSERGRILLELLQTSPLSKSALKTKVEEKMKSFISNFDLVIDPLLKTDLIKQDWIEGDPEIYLFLLNDFLIHRSPAQDVVDEAMRNRPTASLARQYLNASREYFINYKPSVDDSIKLARAMINPDIFDFLVLFRNKAYATKKIPKSPRDAFVKVDDIFKMMEEDKLIIRLKDENGTEWLFLMCDIAVSLFYPEYLAENLRVNFINGTVRKEIAVHHLNILEKAYKT